MEGKATWGSEGNGNFGGYLGFGDVYIVSESNPDTGYLEEIVSKIILLGLKQLPTIP
jgi:hypothetical protein